MDLNEYQVLSMRTCSCDNKKDMLNHAIWGLISEYDELVECTTKDFIDVEDTTHIIKEAGDVAWMIAEACTALQFDMDYLYDTKEFARGDQRVIRMQLTGMMQKTYQGHHIVEYKMKRYLSWYWHSAINKVTSYVCCSTDEAIETVLTTNIEKLKNRYPDGFSAERSLHRAKGDI